MSSNPLAFLDDPAPTDLGLVLYIPPPASPHQYPTLFASLCRTTNLFQLLEVLSKADAIQVLSHLEIIPDAYKPQSLLAMLSLMESALKHKESEIRSREVGARIREVHERMGKKDGEKKDREKTDREKKDREKTDREKTDREKTDREKKDREFEAGNKEGMKRRCAYEAMNGHINNTQRENGEDAKRTKTGKTQEKGPMATRNEEHSEPNHLIQLLVEILGLNHPGIGAERKQEEPGAWIRRFTKLVVVAFSARVVVNHSVREKFAPLVLFGP